MAEEGLKRTENELIHIGMPIPFDINEFLVNLDELTDKAYRAGQLRPRPILQCSVSFLRKRLPENQGFALRQGRFCPDAKKIRWKR